MNDRLFYHPRFAEWWFFYEKKEVYTMTKEELGAIGLTEEQVTKVLETVNKDFVPKTTFDTVNTELQTAKGTIQERDKQLETLQKADGDVEALKQTITNLQTENKNQQKLHEDEMKAIKIGNAVDAALRDAKAINPATVKPLLDTFLKNATLADDGTIAGLADEIGKLIKAEGTSFLFQAETNSALAISGASPAGVVTTTPDAKTVGYETRLSDARKAGNAALVVAIKREAAADGVQLF